MQITDFGLWFRLWNTPSGHQWSTTISQYSGPLLIYYDGWTLGLHYYDSDFELQVWDDGPHIIALKSVFPKVGEGWYRVDRRLTMDDFDIVENPNYEGSI